MSSAERADLPQVILSAPAQSSHLETESRPSKRQRITIACTSCRQRKSRCDGARPKCSTCSSHGYECTYSYVASLTKSSASKEYLETLESRLAAVESSIAGLQSKVTHIGAVQDQNGTPPWSTPTCNQGHLGYTDDERGTIETQDPTDGIGSVVFTKEEESGFFGPSSNIAFTRQIVRATTTLLKTAASAASPVSPDNVAMQSHMLHVSRPPSPTSNRLRLSENFAIGTEPFILPQEEETIRLIELYFNTTGLLFPYVDKEAFFKTYQQLTSTNIRTVRKSWLGLLNMVLAMSTSTSHGSPLSATERAAKSDIFYRRALALCDHQIRLGTSLEVVQLLLLMSQYLQGTERSIETWNVHGLAVKAAYQLGLHSPKALSQFSPLEREIRKRTWFGCVVLDRTLSMTMGRPASIPENFVKLELPISLKVSSESTQTNDDMIQTDTESVQFFTATITLYKIMGEVVDVLYGSNIGSTVPDDVFEIASSLLQFEQKFLIWQSSLPDAISIIQPDALNFDTGRTNSLRFRIILTLRFLNLRILTHRTMLCKCLEILSSSSSGSQQLAVVRQVGSNNLRICVQSALDIIKLIRGVLTPTTDTRRQLLGAWWFSLYYTFNAALVIHSTLLVQHQAKILNQPLAFDDLELSVESLHQAIECLSLLFKGNRMTEKCVRYTSALAQMLSSIFRLNEPPETNSSGHLLEISEVPRNTTEFNSQGEFEFFDLTDLHMGMDLSDLLGPSNFDFMPPVSDSTFTNSGRSRN